MNNEEVIEKLKIAAHACKESLDTCADILQSVPQNPPGGTTKRTYLFSAVSFLQRTFGFIDFVGSKLSQDIRNEQMDQVEMEKKRQEEQRLMENPILLGTTEKYHYNGKKRKAPKNAKEFFVEIDGKINEPKSSKRVSRNSHKKIKDSSKV